MKEELRRFRGVGVAMVTPMRADGSPDLAGVARHARWLVDEGVHFLVPCGTTGESATLEAGEQAEVIAAVVEEVGDATPVMAGAGANSTAKAAKLAEAARKAGADAILSVGPYYNKPTQQGYFEHFRAVAEAGELPLFVYNVPGRTASHIRPETVLRLAHEVEGVAGVKEASGDLENAMTILAGRPDDFLVLSGEDSLALATVACGGDGVVSVVGNEAPGPFSRMVQAALDDRMDEARAAHYKLLSLMRANFVETNPIPVKAALEIMGRIEAHYRLPLTPISDEGRKMLKNALDEAGVL